MGWFGMYQRPSGAAVNKTPKPNMTNNFIVLSGGCDKSRVPSAKTFGLIVKVGKW